MKMNVLFNTYHWFMSISYPQIKKRMAVTLHLSVCDNRLNWTCINGRVQFMCIRNICIIVLFLSTGIIWYYHRHLDNIQFITNFYSDTHQHTSAATQIHVLFGFCLLNECANIWIACIDFCFNSDFSYYENNIEFFEWRRWSENRLHFHYLIYDVECTSSR